MNYFSQKYAEYRIEKVGLSDLKPTKVGSAELQYKKASCKLQGYIDHFVHVEDFNVPILLINGKIWMSCTPMEIASHVVPIKKSKGVVGVGGLGLGYYVLSIMGSDLVSKIDVYEINNDVIKLFKKLHSKNKGFDKINFITGDIYEEIEKSETQYDFFYNDIYGELGSQEAVDDVSFFKEMKIKEYFYWGMEYDMYNSICNGAFGAVVVLLHDENISELMKHWTAFNKDMLSWLARDDDNNFNEKAFELLDESLFP